MTPRKKKKRSEKDVPAFEVMLQELERAVATLEKGNLPLQESIDLFEKGMHLAQECMTQLDGAEKRVEMLLQKRGKEVRRPFLSTDTENRLETEEEGSFEDEPE